MSGTQVGGVDGIDLDARDAAHSCEPYLSLYARCGPISIWIVDGDWIRNSGEVENEDFTNFGTGLAFTFIPADEFWLDEEADPGEYEFFIEHMLIEYKAMERGLSYDQALELADRKEHGMRLKYERIPLGESTHIDPHLVLLMQLE